jgi:hypothetical protein
MVIAYGGDGDGELPPGENSTTMVRLDQPGFYYFGALCGALAAGTLHDTLPRGRAQGLSVLASLALGAAAALALSDPSSSTWLAPPLTRWACASWYLVVAACGVARGAILAAVPCLAADAYGDAHVGAIVGALSLAAAAGAVSLDNGLARVAAIDGGGGDFHRVFRGQAFLALGCTPVVWRFLITHAARVEAMDADAALATPLLRAAKRAAEDAAAAATTTTTMTGASPTEYDEIMALDMASEMWRPSNDGRGSRVDMMSDMPEGFTALL